MTGGYAGKILIVDLTTGKIENKETPQEYVRHFLGGYSFGARMLYDMMKPGTDPLGKDSVLGFVTGPLTGTTALFSGRYTIVCKSPVSGTWNDANSGGFFGPELKKAGFDGVFITGVAECPVYLWIKNGQAELRDASGLWGQDTHVCHNSLISETGEAKLRAAIIGRAGEMQSLLACVINDRHRAAGRGGVGAVMGSKNLKALAVRGTGRIPVANLQGLKEVNAAILDGMVNGEMSYVVDAFKEFGTGMSTGGSIAIGDMPIKNWSGVGDVDIDEDLGMALTADEIDDKYKIGGYGCANCPMKCGAIYNVSSGSWPVGETSRPEYQTVAAFGPLNLNTDVAAIIKCNEICSRQGLDTISTGATIAWAIECYQAGVLTQDDTGGIELTWGDPKLIVSLTQDIADQKGFGKILALGSAGAAAFLGRGTELLQTVRGIELPMHDPRNAPGYARTYQFDPTPARHVKGGIGQMQLGDSSMAKYDPKGKGVIDLEATLANELLDISGLCQFSNFAGVRGHTGKMINAVTGWDLTDVEIRNLGMRSIQMRQAFNLREGLTPADFNIPDRAVGKTPQTEGPLTGITVQHEALAAEFFNTIGWDQNTGRPTKKAIRELGGFDDILNELALV